MSLSNPLWKIFSSPTSYASVIHNNNLNLFWADLKTKGIAEREVGDLTENGSGDRVG